MSSKLEAARRFNVTNDYVARLALNGRLSGIIENGTWYIEEDALKSFFTGRKEQRNTVTPIASKTVSSREAAKVYRVTHDYISRLCRQGKLRGVLEGRNWVVEVGSLEEFFKKPYPSAAPAADAPGVRARGDAGIYSEKTTHKYFLEIGSGGCSTFIVLCFRRFGHGRRKSQ